MTHLGDHHESMNLLYTAKLLIFYNIVGYQLYLAPDTDSYGLHVLSGQA